MYRLITFHLHLKEIKAVMKHYNQIEINAEERKIVKEFYRRLMGDIHDQGLNNSDVLK